MLQAIIRFSLNNRGLVLMAALAMLVAGGYQIREIPVDVFPDLNRPTVTIMTESSGMAPEEVEVLVTRPIEAILNGATGVQRVRSTSGVGLSIVWVEFDWHTDIYRDRQIVAERLQNVRAQLPGDLRPTIAPISSIMGEIMLLGLRPRQVALDRDQQQAQQMELRTMAEFTIRNRLLAIEGVSQVTVMGGILRQYQVITSPARLAAQDLTLQQLTTAIEKANVISGGGIMAGDYQESLIRIRGESLSLRDLEETPIEYRGRRAVLVREVADVRFAGPIARGSGSVRVKTPTEIEGGDAVILAIQKQPGEDTLRLDREITVVLDELEQTLASEVVIERRIFQQASFISSAIENVMDAIRDGALWVTVVLVLFMWNFRTSLCSLVALPLSILLTFLVFRLFGVTINTMTLGGIAVAIGDLVDDSIVDIENIYRRLKENRHRPIDQRQSSMEVIYAASCEVRHSIVYATWIVVLVVVPLFAIGGLEGRMFAPLGIAYMTSLLASLVVSLTVTPVMASFLLPRARFLDRQRESILLRLLKSGMRPVLGWTLRHTTLVIAATLIGVVLSVACIAGMGGEFLPPFQEGTLTISLQVDPGTSLQESERVARRAEEMILEIPEVTSVSRRTGRAELDEHAEGVHSSEIDVQLMPHRTAKDGFLWAILRHIPIAHLWAFQTHGRPQSDVMADLRDRVTEIPGAKVNIGQPISHRLDHLMSGIRAQIAIKVFGDDLRLIRDASQDVLLAMSEVRGVVDLQIEPQVEVPQIRLQVRREDAARYGFAPGDIAQWVETAYKGRVVSQVFDEDRYYDLVVWYDEASRNDPEIIKQTILQSPSGRRVSLGEVVEVIETSGPIALNREHVQRRIAVYCNVQDRDLTSVVDEIRRRVAPIEQRLRSYPGNYSLEFGGQFQAQQQANSQLFVFGSCAVVGIVLLLRSCLESWNAALQVLVNIPLAAIGSVITLLIVNRPETQALQGVPWWQWPSVWASATTLSVAHWVGFITLIGIVSRNGILMISHYIHLMRYEGESFGAEMIIRGSLERIAPVMMTAVTSFVGLAPLLFGGGETGKEILYPLALVVFGGMVTSTLLDQLVTPALFYRFGRMPALHDGAERAAGFAAIPAAPNHLPRDVVGED